MNSNQEPRGHEKNSATPQPNAELVELAEENGAEITPWLPADLEAFFEGRITLGELENVPKEDQYQMAETGYVFLTEGKLKAARQVFGGLHALDPFDAYFLTALGSIAQREGDMETAEVHYTRALEINPSSVPARAHRGEVRVLRGQVLEGIDDLLQVAKTDPEGVDPAAQRAQAIARSVEQLLGETVES